MAVKFRHANMEMANLYIRDKAKEKNWEKGMILKKWRSFLMSSDERHTLWKIIVKKYVYLRTVDLVLTTHCSLRCSECANLMQYYKNPYDVDLLTIKKSIDSLLKVVDEIGIVVLVGGEPFLYKDICNIIQYISELEKINHIHIYTNGTIIPSDAIFNVLRNEKVKVIISDYGDISRNKYSLVQKCKENSVDVYLKNKDLIWGYVGDMSRRGRTERELRTQFRRCKNYCRSILNGKLYYCPRAGHGHDLGIVDTKERDYIGLIDARLTSHEIINIAYSTHFFSACDYCNYGTKDMIPIIPGEQMARNEKRDIS